MNGDVFYGLGIPIKFQDPDDFLKIKETLTRIGIANEKTKTLYQSCHILHKRGEYAIMHFKELFAIDGRPSSIDIEDLARRNLIVDLLYTWELLELTYPDSLETFADMPPPRIKIIPFKEKRDWKLVAKYQIGNNKEK